MTTLRFDTEGAGLETYFAQFIGRLAGEANRPELLSAVRLLSRSREEGHICINLVDLCRDMQGMGPNELKDLLLASPVVGKPGESAPLIVDDTALYLHRYYQAESLVVDFIQKRQKVDLEASALPPLSEALKKYFPAKEDRETDWQQVAAMAAISGRFTVISGGPGTGKTTTVAKILAIYQETHQGLDKIVRLAAPTGKAAARLQESIQKIKLQLPLTDELRQSLDHETVTLHRLLGLAGGKPRYDRHHPLAADLVVVDEASMVDLPLMAQLMAALPETCNLILLGDHYQLSSVQPGAVLGDICSKGEGFTRRFQELAADLGVELGPVVSRRNPLADTIITLRTSYRFDANSGIRRLSESVNAGMGEEALALLADRDLPDVTLIDDDVTPEKFVAEKVHPAFTGSYLPKAGNDQLAALGRLGVLCAHRSGPYGMEKVNELMVRLEYGGEAETKPLYAGLPIMIAKNSYELELYNGDTGVINEYDGRLYACFPAYQEVRRILARRLPPYNPAYAMTVHKSQGSEFDRVIVILPGQSSRVLGRELLYTALTRARQSVEVWGSKEIFLQAVATPVQRASGLARRLWTE